MLFARHGETDYTRAGLLQGWRDVPLNAVGFEQAAALAVLLGGNGIRRIVASPLARAHSTARIVGDALGLVPELEPRLRERRWGSLEGELRANRVKPYPADVETLADFHARVAAAYRDITDPAATLVVAHSGVLRQLGRLLAPDTGRWALPPGGLCRIEAPGEEGAWRVSVLA